jgi:hypothetical protein
MNSKYLAQFLIVSLLNELLFASFVSGSFGMMGTHCATVMPKDIQFFSKLFEKLSLLDIEV